MQFSSSTVSTLFHTLSIKSLLLFWLWESFERWYKFKSCVYISSMWQTNDTWYFKSKYFIILFKVGFLISFSLYYCYPSQMTSSAIFPWQALNRAKMRDYSIKHRLRRGGRHSNEVWLMVQWKKQKMATKGSSGRSWYGYPFILGPKKKRCEEADYCYYYSKTNIDYSFLKKCVLLCQGYFRIGPPFHHSTPTIIKK